MPSGSHFRYGFRWLERALWIAGCCALLYCCFLAIDAALIQGALARSFEQSRIRITAPSQPASNSPAKHAHPPPAQPGTRQAVRLEISRIGLSAMVLEGVDSRTLRVGIGHVPGTSWPGQPGNVVIAGHRDTFFRPLRNIQLCDEFALATTARTYHYRVSSFEVVEPHDVDALKFHGKNELTLITCYPFSFIGPAPKRFVVHAEPVLVPRKCRIPLFVP